MAEGEGKGELEIEGRLTLKDAASHVIEKVEKVAERLKETLGEGMRIAGFAGGIAGMFEIHDTVRELGDMYRAVGRVKAVTGATAEDAHATLDVLDNWGLGLEGAERVITRMTGKMEMFEDGGVAGAQAAREMQDMYKKLGIDMKAGPAEQLSRMSELAEAGKLDVATMRKLFNVSTQQAGTMLEGLKRGPEEMEKALGKVKESAGVIDENALASFNRMKMAKEEMRSSWALLANTIYKNILPIGTRLVQFIQHTIERWTPAVARFGKILNAHLATAFKLVTNMFKMMAANKILSMAGFAGGPLTKLAGAAILPSITSAMSMVAGNINHWGEKIGTALSQVTAAFQWVFDQVSSVLKPIFSSLGLDMSTGANLLLSAAQKIAEGWTDVIIMIKSLAQWLWEKIRNIAHVAITSPVDQAIEYGKIISGEKKAPINKSLQDFYLENEAMNNMAATAGRWRSFNANMMAQMDEIKKNALTAAKSPGNRPQVNQDFRGSRFDIKQEFAQGFDPDRVATAFSNELATLGERSRQSPFSPLFTVR